LLAYITVVPAADSMTIPVSASTVAAATFPLRKVSAPVPSPLTVLA